MHTQPQSNQAVANEQHLPQSVLDRLMADEQDILAVTAPSILDTILAEADTTVPATPVPVAISLLDTAVDATIRQEGSKRQRKAEPVRKPSVASDVRLTPMGDEPNLDFQSTLFGIQAEHFADDRPLPGNIHGRQISLMPKPSRGVLCGICRKWSCPLSGPRD